MAQRTALADMTPKQIDAELANIHGSLFVNQRSIDAWTERAHEAADDRKLGSGRNRFWKMSDTEALNIVEQLADTHEPQPWDRHNYKKIIASVLTLQRDRSALMMEQLGYDSEYERRGGWSRFFLVTSSDGHIHRSTGCQTCTLATEFRWLPELSDETEADAVAAHGPLLCTICFPSAPVEWTIGKKATRPRCSGVDQPATEVKHFPRTSYGTCQGCGDRHPINANGKPRAHKPAK